MIRVLLHKIGIRGKTTMREITTELEWEDVVAESKAKPLLVFKHSTRCPISFSAHDRVEAYRKSHENGPEVVLVKVVESRPISNRIAEDTGVVHASPQMILLRDGAAAWDASHHGIHEEAIDNAIAQHAAS